MASTALSAFKKYRRQKDVNEQDETSKTPSQRATRANKKKGLNRRKSEKGEGTMMTMISKLMNNDEGSVRKKGKKGKNLNLKAKKDDAGTKRDAGVPPVSPANPANICWDPATIVNELLQSGKIDISGNEDVRSAMQAFAKKAAQITASGALNEYVTCLKTYVPDNTTRIAFDANADKNRYQDVICADRERVKLVDRPNLTDYIHANHIVGKPFPPNHAYICTQGPFPHTVPELWRLIRQEQVDSIVMLCETVECGKNKCAQYWPLGHGETMTVLDFVITNKGTYTHEPGLISTVLCLKDASGGEQRVIHHQWKSWPDKGVPERTDITLKLLQLTRPAASDPKQCTVVHCSAGIGRTGSVVAVELCAQRLLSGKTADVLSLVKHLRTKRMHSIQTDQQYLFVYKVLLALIRELVTDPDTQQAIDSYNFGYDAIVRSSAPQPQSGAAPDPFANAPSPFPPADYGNGTAPPQPADQVHITSLRSNNNFMSY